MIRNSYGIDGGRPPHYYHLYHFYYQYTIFTTLSLFIFLSSLSFTPFILLITIYIYCFLPPIYFSIQLLFLI